MAQVTQTFEEFMITFVRRAVTRLRVDDDIPLPPGLRELERNKLLLAQIRMTAHLRAAVDQYLSALILQGGREPAEALLDEILNAEPPGRPTWKEIGDALGVSAQAAHHKYARLTQRS